MYDLIPSQYGQATEGADSKRRKRSKRSKVTSIAQWVECFNAYIGIIAYHQPERVHDLLAYSSLIVHASRTYKGDGWV